MSILFSEIIFGPVQSRRLGVSLGVNLLPSSYKFCTFNCIYCECGWTYPSKEGGEKLPERGEIRTGLEKKLKELRAKGSRIDAITFAGNGEPTVHPWFPEIMDDVIGLRDKYFPDTAVTVLTNGSTLGKSSVFQALLKADKSMIKLDAGTEELFRLINGPRQGVTLEDIVSKMKEFKGKLIIQTLFLRGRVDGRMIDNTAEPELTSWLDKVKEVGPGEVAIYPIDRSTPAEGLEKISFDELRRIADRIEKEGIRVQVYS